MPDITFENSEGNQQKMHGSDNRADVSSRSSDRIHFVSRDDGQAYTVVSHDATAASGTYIIYLQNTNTNNQLMFIDKVDAHGVEAALFKLWFVTGTAAGGSALTPVNLNKTSSNSATANARGGDSITGLTAGGEIWPFRIAATGEKEENFDDAIILGQNDAIALEIDTDDGSPAIAGASIRFYLGTG